MRDPQHRQSLPTSLFQSPGEAGRTQSLVPAGRVWVLCPSVSPCPLVPQVVRAKERLDEELRIRAKDEKDKGWKAET